MDHSPADCFNIRDEGLWFVGASVIDASEPLVCCLKDVPTEQIRIHVCWGNYAGPHHKDNTT